MKFLVVTNLWLVILWNRKPSPGDSARALTLVALAVCILASSCAGAPTPKTAPSPESADVEAADTDNDSPVSGTPAAEPGRIETAVFDAELVHDDTGALAGVRLLACDINSPLSAVFYCAPEVTTREPIPVNFHEIANTPVHSIEQLSELERQLGDCDTVPVAVSYDSDGKVTQTTLNACDP